MPNRGQRTGARKYQEIKKPFACIKNPNIDNPIHRGWIFDSIPASRFLQRPVTESLGKFLISNDREPNSVRFVPNIQIN
jgi:hypothetical protein